MKQNSAQEDLVMNNVKLPFPKERYFEEAGGKCSVKFEIPLQTKKIGINPLFLNKADLD